MATAIDFPERNDVLGKPPSTTDNQVYGLHICRAIVNIPGEKEEDAPIPTHAHISFWKFTPEELEEIQRNGGCFVMMIGLTTYPFSVHGINPIPTANRVFTREEVEDWHNRNEERRQQKEN